MQDQNAIRQIVNALIRELPVSEIEFQHFYFSDTMHDAEWLLQEKNSLIWLVTKHGTHSCTSIESAMDVITSCGVVAAFHVEPQFWRETEEYHRLEIKPLDLETMRQLTAFKLTY